MSTVIVEAVLEESPAVTMTVAELIGASLYEAFPEEFSELLLTEASVQDLWGSAVKAFPKTQRRQKVIDRVKTETVQWQPFPKLKIILAAAKILGEKYSDGRRPSQRRYRTHIMFRNTKFHESPVKGSLKVTNRSKTPTMPRGEIYFEKPTFNQSVRVRCNCPDFQYRFNWECDSQSPSALLGPKAPPYTPKDPANYRGPANPSGLPGICKHIMNTGIALYKSGAILMR